MIEFNKIGEDLFNKIRGRFPEVTIGNEEGAITNEPSQARFFDFDFKEGDVTLGKVSVSISEDEGLTVIYSKDFVEGQDEMTQDSWYNFLKELRIFSKKRMLDFSVRDINKSNLTKRDYKFLANRSGDGTMNESKLYGTSTQSYQKIGEARLVIKHTESINQESATGRTQKIGKIYIESPEGERFKYPFKHLSGARAMARHVAEGGNAYDEFGKHIVGLSEEMAKLRKFKTYMGRSAVMAESLAGYMDIVKERIATVKKTIESLQKPAYYKEAFDSFNPPVLEDVPSDVAENWIDELTIRQFNEELQDIFPYIYNLVKEGTRAKALGPDDVLGESEEELDEVAPLIAAGVMAAARAAVPQLSRMGASILAKRGAAMGAAGQVAKGAGRVIARNPGKAAAIGGGAYLGKQVSDTVDDLATSAEELMAKASSGISAIQGEISAFLGGGALKQVTSLAAKYALPALAVVAILYGGKKVIDWLSGKGKEPQVEDIDIDESALMAYAGKKKHGAEYMKKAAEAGRKGASQEELGRLKDKYSKAEKKTKEELELEAAFEGTLGQFSDHVCEECGNPSWRTLGLNESELEAYALEEEKKKGKDGKACWSGYYLAGTKMKNGKEVDDCRPRKKPKKESEDLDEAYIKTRKDAVEVLGRLRGIGKKIETGKDTYDGNLANEYVSDVYDVINWMDARLGISGMNDPKLKQVLDPVVELRKEAKGLETKPGSGENARFGNKIVNTLYPLMVYIEDHMEEPKDEDNDTLDVKMTPDGGIEKADAEEQKTPLGEFILSYYDRETGQFPKGETAVLTMVEKDYGEQFIEPAKAFIESIHQTFETFQQSKPRIEDTEEYQRMRELAGLR